MTAQADSTKCSLLNIPTPQEVIERIEQLPSLVLDTPTVQKGVEKYWRDIQKENLGFRQLQQLKSAQSANSISTADLREQLTDLLAENISTSSAMLGKRQISMKERRRLEASKYLMQSIVRELGSLKEPNRQERRRAEKKAQAKQKSEAQKPDQAKEQSQPEQQENPGQESKPEEQDSPQAGQESKSQDQPPSSQRSPQKDQQPNQQAAQKSQSQQPNQQGQQGQPDQKQDQPGQKQDRRSQNSQESSDPHGSKQGQEAEKSSDQQQSSPPSPQNKSSQQKSLNQQEQQQGEQDQRSQNSEKSSESQSNVEPQSSSQSQKPEQQPGSEQQAKGQPAKSDQQVESGQKSQPSQQQDQRSQNPQKLAENQDSKQSQQPSEQDSKPGKQSEQGKQESEQGQQGQQSGKGEVGNNQQQEKPQQEEKPQKATSAKKELSQDQRAEKRSRKLGDPNQKEQDQQRRESTAAPSRASERKDNAEAGSSSADSFVNKNTMKDLFRPQPGNPKEEKKDKSPLESILDRLKKETTRENKNEEKPPQLDHDKVKAKVPEILQDLVKRAWIAALRSYGSSRVFTQNLTLFRDFCNETLRQSDWTFTRQYIQRSNELVSAAEFSGVSFENYESLAALMLRPNQNVFPAVKYLNRIMLELKEVTILTAEETQLLRITNEILAKFSPAADADVTLAKSFYAAMKGPLSRRSIREKYAITLDGGRWKELADDIRSGELNSYLMLPHVRNFLRLKHFHMLAPRWDEKNIGPRRPQDNEEAKIEIADDLQNWKDFYRDGPPDQDILRMISGDKLMYAYREPVANRNFNKPKEHIVTVVVFDISDSMRQDPRRYMIQNALITSYLDLSQIQVVRNEAEHSIVMIPFGKHVHQPEALSNLQAVYDYFERIINNPITSDSGTDINGAILKSYDYIAKNSDKAGWKKANILFLTDGGAQFNVNAIVQKRKEIDKRIDLSFTTINIVEGNVEFDAASRDGLGSAAFARFSYRFLTGPEVSEIVDGAQNIKMIEEGSKFQSTTTTFPTHELTWLSQAIRSVSEVAIDNYEIFRWKDKLQKWSTDNVEDNAVSTLAMRTLFEIKLSEELAPSRVQTAKTQLAIQTIRAIAKHLRLTEDQALGLLTQSEFKGLKKWLGIKGEQNE